MTLSKRFSTGWLGRDKATCKAVGPGGDGVPNDAGLGGGGSVPLLVLSWKLDGRLGESWAGQRAGVFRAGGF